MQHRSTILLVTGASGFLGRAVMERFSAEHRVIGVGFRHAQEGVRSVDIRDGRAFRNVLEEVRPDTVIHCAAYRDPDFCEREQEEARRLNVAPVRTLVDTLPAESRLVFISTDYVFDGNQPPYREADERRPINVYGQSKVEAEDLARERASSLIVRIPLLMGYGPSFEESGFIAKTAQVIAGREPAELDNRTMRFPTDIRDVAEVVYFLLHRNAAGVYHYAGPRGQTQYRWALELADIMGVDASPLCPVTMPPARIAARPADSQLAMEKIRELGFDRSTDFKEVAGWVLAMQS